MITPARKLARVDYRESAIGKQTRPVRTPKGHRNGLPIYTRMKHSNPERKNRMRGDTTYAAFHRWVSDGWLCFLEGRRDRVTGKIHRCTGRKVGHHMVPVGRGGKDADGEVPACVLAHQLCEDHGNAWVEDRFGVGMEEIATRLWLRWQKYIGESGAEVES